MDKFTNITKTIFSFFRSLGYEVYLDNNVSENATFPYITIRYEIDDFGVDSLLQGQIWDKAQSRENVNKVSDELLTVINTGIKVRIVNDRGYLYLRKGSPFIQPITETEGYQVNYFNIIVKSFY